MGLLVLREADWLRMSENRVLTKTYSPQTRNNRILKRNA
jgi:hypothetical protein